MKLLTFITTLTIEKSIMLILTPILAILMPLIPLLIGTGLFFLFDFFTGIRKSLHNSKVALKPFTRGFFTRLFSVITSEKIRNTFKKLGEYNIIVITFAIIEAFFFGRPITFEVLLDRSFSLTELAIWGIAAVELYSIGENLEEVTGRNLIKLFFRVIYYIITLNKKELKNLFLDITEPK